MESIKHDFLHNTKKLDLKTYKQQFADMMSNIDRINQVLGKKRASLDTVYAVAIGQITGVFIGFKDATYTKKQFIAKVSAILDYVDNWQELK